MKKIEYCLNRSHQRLSFPRVEDRCAYEKFAVTSVADYMRSIFWTFVFHAVQC